MSRSSRSETLSAALLRKWPLPRIDPGGSKDTRGAVLVVGGAPSMPGAAVLAATAALRAGAGKLQIATTRSVAPLVAAEVPEALVVGVPESRAGAMTLAGAREIAKRAADAHAVLLGPGMVDPDATARFVLEVLARAGEVPFVLDAAALAAASRDPEAVAAAAGRLVLTPHAGEMGKMLGIDRAAVERDRPRIALQAARDLRAVIALKGAETILADATGRLLVNRRAGNAGLGTSGSGDTLSGVVAGLLARGAEPLQAAAWGVFLHGRAGDILARRVGPVGYLARELLAEIPREMARLSRGR
jgi:hydroxyethylthiazole kinase-like uncharacterized protein yjeF